MSQQARGPSACWPLQLQQLSQVIAEAAVAQSVKVTAMLNGLRFSNLTAAEAEALDVVTCRRRHAGTA